MRLQHLALGLALATVAASAATAAQAADGIFVPLFTYRTGPFAGSGIPIANGMADYLNMLNERDGGIGGVKLIVEECETGYDTKQGVECYDSVKDRNPVVINPYSTGLTLQLIPKAAVDKIPILSMAYGLSASADGNDFPWIFNPPDTYWDGASAFIRHAANVEGGFDKLKGKKIGLLYLDVPYGKEPIPLLQALAKDYDFTLTLYPVHASAMYEMQNQGSVWLYVRIDAARLDLSSGLGRDEPGRDQGGGRERLSDESADRQLVVEQRGRRASGGRTGRGLHCTRHQRRRRELSGHSGHSQIRGRQGQEPGPLKGQGRRKLL